MRYTFLALLALTAACASVPRSDGYDGTTQVERDASRCLQNGPCTVLQIQNDNFYDAVIYLNGSRVGEVTGLHNGPIFVHDSQLRDGRCATIVVRLIGRGSVASSTKECARDVEHFQLDIAPSSALMPLHIWLIPRQ